MPSKKYYAEHSAQYKASRKRKYYAALEAERAAARHYQKQLRINDPLYELRHDLQKNYGMSLDEYEAKKQAQNNLCAICGKPETRIIRGKLARLVVDHDHGTKENRDLLCSRCNTLIGMAFESISILKSAILYLMKWKVRGL